MNSISAHEKIYTLKKPKLNGLPPLDGLIEIMYWSLCEDAVYPYHNVNAGEFQRCGIFLLVTERQIKTHNTLLAL